MVPQRLQLVTLTGAAWQKWLCLAACTTTPLTTPPYCHASSQGNICKHILFVMLRVLHMSPDEPLVWQKALLSSEVDEASTAAAAGTAVCCPYSRHPPPLLLGAKRRCWA